MSPNPEHKPVVRLNSVGIFAKAARGLLVVIGVAFAWWAIDLGDAASSGVNDPVVKRLNLQSAIPDPAASANGTPSPTDGASSAGSAGARF